MLKRLLSVLGGIIVLALLFVPFIENSSQLVSAQISQASGKALMSFGQAPANIAVGDSFNLAILLAANGEKMDTMRVSFNFPADKLEATHFRLGNLFPNVSPANQLDNQKGLVYQGGFSITGPVSENGTLGEVTFKAKSAGSATLTFNDNSLLLGAGEVKNGNLAGRSTTITIAQAEQEPQAPANTVLSPEGKVLFTVNSPSHPDSQTWLANNTVTMEWDVEEGSDVVKFFFAFDEKPDTNPKQLIPEAPAKGNRLVFDRVSDGVWYFHLKGQNSAGKDSKVVHYPVQIDVTQPNVIAPFLDKAEVASGESVQLSFGTLDQTSGIAYYTVRVDDKDLGRQTSPYSLSVREAGEHAVRVQAYDRAGNASEGSVKLTVKGAQKAVSPATVDSLLKIAVLAVVIIALIVLKKLLKKFKRK